MYDYPEEEQDYEASSALDTLFRGEEIKQKDEDFIERIAEEIDRRQSILASIRDSLEYLCGGEEDDDEEDYDSASKDLNDFFARMQAARKKQIMAQEETPSERRRRIYKKSEPVINGVIVRKFT